MNHNSQPSPPLNTECRTYVWPRDIVVTSTGRLTNRLLVSRQRGLCHGTRVSGTSLGQRTRRGHIRPPCGSTATLHHHLDVVSGAHDNILRILVPQIVHINTVDLHQDIAGNQTRRVGQTASVHLKTSRKWLRLATQLNILVSVPHPKHKFRFYSVLCVISSFNGRLPKIINWNSVPVIARLINRSWSLYVVYKLINFVSRAQRTISTLKCRKCIGGN